MKLPVQKCVITSMLCREVITDCFFVPLFFYKINKFKLSASSWLFRGLMKFCALLVYSEHVNSNFSGCQASFELCATALLVC